LRGLAIPTHDEMNILQHERFNLSLALHAYDYFNSNFKEYTCIYFRKAYVLIKRYIMVHLSVIVVATMFTACTFLDRCTKERRIACHKDHGLNKMACCNSVLCFAGVI